MVSPRIKYAMAHLSHKQHISLLARPNWRRTQRRDINTANPNFIPPAALKCRASKRLKIMSQPKSVTKKYDPAKAPPPYQRVHPKTLAATSSRRIVDLALPKKPVLLSTLKFAVNNKQMAVKVSDLLQRLQQSRYQRYRIFCNAFMERSTARERRIRQKLRRALTKPEDWTRHTEYLERIAAPKKVPKQRPVTRRKRWRPVDMRRMDALAQPASKETPEVRDPAKVLARALAYRITARMREIAVHKHSPADVAPPRIPGAVTPAAMRAVASSRTVILAKPLERPTGTETDLREDAFTVSPTALKARCTKRIKNLAKPKTYGKAKG